MRWVEAIGAMLGKKDGRNKRRKKGRELVGMVIPVQLVGFSSYSFSMRACVHACIHTYMRTCSIRALHALASRTERNRTEQSVLFFLPPLGTMRRRRGRPVGDM